uniref:Uncharacterized protein n=1 Tax=Mycena chlorophos TaxID=658473 RepID=A0ABQ0LJU5_MYCCL|nr:predicted protein [Mycena chlorophos]
MAAPQKIRRAARDDIRNPTRVRDVRSVRSVTFVHIPSPQLTRNSLEADSCSTQTRAPEEYKGDAPVITFLEDNTEATMAAGRGYFLVWRLDANQVCAFAGHNGDVRFQPTNTEQLRQYAHSLYTVNPFPEFFWNVLDLLEEMEETAVVSLLRVPPTSYNSSARAKQPAAPSRTKDFFEEEKDKTEWLWDNTRLMDYGVPTTEPIPGERLSEGAGLRWYIMWLQRLGASDDHAALALYDATSGFGSPIDALHPHLVVTVLWHGLVVGA